MDGHHHSFFVLLSFGSWLGQELTVLANNPPINGADTDLAQAPTAVLIGLGLAATSLRLTGYTGRPQLLADQQATAGA